MMSRLRQSWHLLVLGAVLPCVGTIAQAQRGLEPSQQDLREAREVFEEALVLVEQERWQEAEERFRLVLEVRSSPVVSYNLASTLVHQGRLVDAAEVLRGVVRDGDADEDSRTAAEQLLAEVEPGIGSLTVRLSGDTEGAVLTIDDRTVEFEALVQAISIDPGVHQVVLKRNGALVASQHVEIGGDSPLHAEVALGLPPPEADLSVAERAARLDTRPDPRLAPQPIDHDPEHDPEYDDGGGLFSSAWFWAGTGAVVAGGVLAALFLVEGGTAAPVGGDTDPPVLRGTVRMEMP